MAAATNTTWELSEVARQTSAPYLAQIGSITDCLNDMERVRVSKEATLKLAASFDTAVDFKEGPMLLDTVQSKFRVDPETKRGFVMVRVNEIKRSAAEVLDLVWSSDPAWVGEGVTHLEPVAEISPTQRILFEEFKKIPMLAPREAAKFTFRYGGDVPIIFIQSVETPLIPRKPGVVRMEFLVEGFVARPLSATSCELIFLLELSLMGIFDDKKCGKLMNCFGLGELLSKSSCDDANAMLLRLKQFAETPAPALAPTLLQKGSNGEKERLLGQHGLEHDRTH